MRLQRIDQLGGARSRAVQFVIDESALYRPIGGHAVLVDQLEHLLTVAALRPSFTVQVLPQGIKAHPGLAASTLYRAAGQRAVFVESLTSSEITTRPDDVAAYSSAWDRLLSLALPPDRSLDLIDATRETLCRRPWASP
ncbi:DUF5753 domain-containing protein [Streptomyces sp. 2A115]|uniref:DUF5753 domain-containing protein n=1 Tax=Streptomyces sp. 2A115 TaxID=3457439 RepID=UPI003FD0C4C5